VILPARRHDGTRRPRIADGTTIGKNRLSGRSARKRSDSRFPSSRTRILAARTRIRDGGSGTIASDASPSGDLPVNDTSAALSRPPPPARRRRWTWIDTALLAAVLTALGWFAYRTEAVMFYRWNWSVVANYLIKVDPATGHWQPNALLDGLFATLRLAVWGLVLATLIGVPMGVARNSRRLFPRLVSGLYVMVIRNIPPLVLVFVVAFFVANQILPGLGIRAALARAPDWLQATCAVLFGPPKIIENIIVGLLCLAIFTGAYVAEIVRAGIESVPRSQIEAGESLGLTRFQILRDVILPQALRNVLPPLANQFIQMIKDSSLVSLVSVQELTFVAQDVQIATQRVFEVFLFVGFLYFAVCWSLSRLFARLEARARAAG
jgi:polar amino acid transport system permease protein